MQSKDLKKCDNSTYFQSNVVQLSEHSLMAEKKSLILVIADLQKESKQALHSFPFARHEKIATSHLTHLLCLAAHGDNDVLWIEQGAIK